MRGRRENIGNLNGDGGLGPAEGLLQWGVQMGKAEQEVEMEEME